MATKILHYHYRNESRWGVVVDDVIHPIGGEYATTGAFVTGGMALVEGARKAKPGPRVGEVEILCPITRNQQFLCQGLNYRSHAHDAGIDPDTFPYNVFFTKAPSSLATANADVVIPHGVQALDYEAEIGLVLAQDVKAPVQVGDGDVHRFVAALTVVNDYSARDVQLPEGQFYKGKSFRGFGPVGPYLTLLTPVEFKRFAELRLRLSVNGEQRQDGYASDMIHGPAESLTELFRFQDVAAGDLLATGTLGGCALKAPNPAMMALFRALPDTVKWPIFIKKAAKSPRVLRPGDRVVTSIRTDDGKIDLGEQSNRVVAAA